MTNEKKPKQADKDAELELMNPGIDYVYVSGAQVFSNNWDLRIFFTDRQPNNRLVPKIGIVMSHEHAKAFSELLQEQVEKVEESFGPNRHIAS